MATFSNTTKALLAQTQHKANQLNILSICMNDCHTLTECLKLEIEIKFETSTLTSTITLEVPTKCWQTRSMYTREAVKVCEDLPPSGACLTVPSSDLKCNKTDDRRAVVNLVLLAVCMLSTLPVERLLETESGTEHRSAKAWGSYSLKTNPIQFKTLTLRL